MRENRRKKTKCIFHWAIVNRLVLYNHSSLHCTSLYTFFVLFFILYFGCSKLLSCPCVWCTVFNMKRNGKWKKDKLRAWSDYFLKSYYRKIDLFFLLLLLLLFRSFWSQYFCFIFKNFFSPIFFSFLQITRKQIYKMVKYIVFGVIGMFYS